VTLGRGGVAGISGGPVSGFSVTLQNNRLRQIDIALAQTSRNLEIRRGHENNAALWLFHSVMILSAHSTRDTKIVGLPNFAPHWLRSVSVTPLARLQAPQA